jgi:hypothetical protein
MISGRGDNAGQTAPSPTCSRSPTVWCCAAAGPRLSRSGWRLRPVVIRPDSGGVPIRADPSLAELGNVDVVVLPPILDGLDDTLAAHPDLIVWMKSRAADDVLLISRKHPQRTPPPRRWWQPLNRHGAQTLGAGWAAEHTVDRVRCLRRRCGHSALRLAVLPEPRISVVHQPHWFPQQKVPNGRRR